MHKFPIDLEAEVTKKGIISSLSLRNVKADASSNKITISELMVSSAITDKIVFNFEYIHGLLTAQKELIEESLASVPDKLSAFKKEKQAFFSIQESLKKEYTGKYVAVYGEMVVDFDIDESALIDRFYKTYGNVPVYIDKVGEEKRVLQIPTPLRIG